MNKQRLLLFTLSALFFVSAPACFPAAYNRVVSLSTYATENLFLLGEGDKIIGVTMYEKPGIKKGRCIVGSFLEPNLERIILLKPDLVLASKEGNRADVVRKLEKFGIRVEVLGELHDYKDIKDNFLRLAALFNKKAAAEKILARVRSRLASVPRSAKPVRVFFQLGVNPIVTIGQNTYIDEMITEAGGVNVFHDVRMKYPVISPEEVIQRNPEVIAVVGMGEKEKVVGYWDRFPLLAAVKHKKIYFLRATPFCSPTPVTYLQSVEALRKMLR